MKSKAGTVSDYIAGLPEGKRETVSKLRAFLARRMPKGYEQSLGYGIIWWAIPLARFPDTYNGLPLGYVALAAQKSYFALYLMSCYMNPPQEKKLREAFRKAGKKLDMGKSCVRFRSLDDLPLDAIGDIVASIPAEKWIEIYKKSREKAARP